ncbi:hypothetical protein BC936DRAFT_149391 [Jimgerdemannia flammicorona]|uniref:P-loop containing nucleoside triphosphate hydrolase protein n=1 Tax=Jimgerdemannia flammicorona TaxID=994334 RepID=A0A433D0X8_9FUNG|nr:hypothetical protein BC936DRAFT_149391 [Jimgerdemannia flammicorona]
MADTYDFLLKFLIIGEAGTGKSCHSSPTLPFLRPIYEQHKVLIMHVVLCPFAVKETSSHTIGVEFGSRIVHIGDKSVKLQIWDTAGQLPRVKFPIHQPRIRNSKLNRILSSLIGTVSVSLLDRNKPEP